MSMNTGQGSLTRAPAIDAQGPNTAITLNVTPAMMGMLEQISRDSHQPLEVVFTKAIALYRAALNAMIDGKSIGYTNSAEGLEVEFTGITSSVGGSW